MPPTAVDSTLAVLQLVRVRLLTYTPTSGGTLASRLGTATGAGQDGKLYIGQAPDDIPLPVGQMRLMNIRQAGEDGWFMRSADVEIQLLHAPREKTGFLEGCADVCEAALRHWVASEAPHLRAKGGLQRGTVFYDADPADREVVQVYLVQPITYVPQFLTA